MYSETSQHTWFHWNQDILGIFLSLFHHLSEQHICFHSYSVSPTYKFRIEKDQCLENSEDIR